MKRAVRALAARPGFTAVAVATLAIGFGVNAAVFSLTRTVLLRPLPYRDADRLVQVNEVNRPRGVMLGAVSPASYDAWRTRVAAFEQTATFLRVSFNVSTPARALQVEGFKVAPAFFPMLGVEMARGRGFATGDAVQGRDNIVVISDRFWRRFFDADPAAVGRSITVDGVPCTVAGILPPSFKIFRVLNRELELFRPQVLDPTDREQSTNLWAKLRPDTSLDAARAELATVYATLPSAARGWTADASSLTERLTEGPRPVLVALEWAVALVLLIACANVANLLLAVATGRRKEIAVRQALGASRWQLARDFGGETIVLTAAGGALALLLAVWVVATLNAVVSFQDVNRLEPFRVDGWVIAFVLALSVAVVAVFAALPIRAATNVDLVDALKDSMHGATAGVSHRRLRHALIVGELALAIVLTVSALALTRSAVSLHGLARGVAVDGVATAQVALNDPRYAAADRMIRATNAILEKLSATPVVEAAALVNYPPLSLIRVGVPVTVEGAAPPPGDQPWIARYFVTSPGYLRAAGIPLLAGRDFDTADDAARAGVAIVSVTFARRFWNSTDVIGRHVTPQFPSSHAFWIPRARVGPLTIVGVAGDVREDGLPDSAGFPQLYLPYAQNPTVVATVMARSRGPVTAAAAAIRDAVRAVDPELPVSYEMTFDDILRETFARPRELAWLIGSFAGLALLLSAIGVYGVMAFLTTARSKEIAIRVALGATRMNVVGLVARDAMKLAAAGVAAGLIATPLTFKVLSAAAYGVDAWNPALLAVVAVALSVVCAGGAAIPAWRAARDASASFRCA
jgi:putative ABC transport system permease protein